MILKPLQKVDSMFDKYSVVKRNKRQKWTYQRQARPMPLCKTYYFSHISQLNNKLLLYIVWLESVYSAD